MSGKINWQCPYCHHHAIAYPQTTDCTIWESQPLLGGMDGLHKLISEAIVCPNDECQRLCLKVKIEKYSTDESWEERHSLQLLPRSAAKPIPGYVPEAIRKNYEEACLVLAGSPNASASLARRCLQGMIRDFHDIKKSSLKKEIDGLENKLDPPVWEAIEKIRHLGNIGAHMDKDVNLIIDVEESEAEQLIGLIEFLIKDWYVARHQHQERLKKLSEIPTDKKTRSQQKSSSTEVETSKPTGEAE